MVCKVFVSLEFDFFLRDADVVRFGQVFVPTVEVQLVADYAWVEAFNLEHLDCILERLLLHQVVFHLTHGSWV